MLAKSSRSPHPIQGRTQMRNVIRGELAALLLVLTLAACGGGGGGGGSSPPPGSGNPPPVTPPPPSGTTVPPQAATAIDLDDNHDVGAHRWDSGDTAEGGQNAPVQG